MDGQTVPAWHQSVHHDGSAQFVHPQRAQLGDTIKIGLRLAADAPVDAIYLRSMPDGEQAITSLTAGALEGGIRWWHGDLTLNEPVVHYRFLLKEHDRLWTYSAAGLRQGTPLDALDFKLLANHDTPDWLHGAVFYQIFPDRFANGDPQNDPTPESFGPSGYIARTYPWGTPPPASQPFPLVFYGGDIPGIHAHLDYLEALGITALYLNPIFTAYSNHRFDVADYDHVDPHLGGDQALIDLRRALDERHMKLILDVVPNHCGYWHPWFQAALADAEAEEAAFFTFTNHPKEYASWLGVWALPKLNYRSAELRQRVYGGSDAFMRRWLRPPFAIDGWRVDVANMLGRQGESQLGRDVVQGMREAVKGERPDSYFMGESFFDATAVLQGDQWDGVMNYTGFADPLRYWLDKHQLWSRELQTSVGPANPWSTAALVDTWQTFLAAIPWQIAFQQFNLLGSHDTPRFRSVVGESDALTRLAAIIQFTFPGIPSLYYGDEIGMVDDAQLASRGCMKWDDAQWHTELLAFYRQLIALRRQSQALQQGGWQLIAVEEDTLAYQRFTADEQIIVIAHRARQPRSPSPLPVAQAGIVDGRRFREQFSDRESMVQAGELALPALPQGATLWLSV